MQPGGNGASLATFTSPNGKVRVKYRTLFTAADGFGKSFLVLEVGEGGVAMLDAQRMARWCIDTFCKTIQLQDEGAWGEERPFTWNALNELTGELAADGWPAILAMEIWRDVVKVEASNLDALKKTLPKPSSEVTPGENQPAQPSHTSTLSGQAG